MRGKQTDTWQLTKKVMRPLIGIARWTAIWFLTTSTASAGNAPLTFDHLSEEQGLSQYTVTSIIQDKIGFIWIATFDGLNRYDGKTIKVIRRQEGTPHSISDNSIWSLMEDRNGYIWIGTQSGGLNQYDPTSGKFKQFRHNPKDPNSLGSDTVRQVVEDTSGMIWAATISAGVTRVDPKTGKTKRYSADPDNPNSISSNDVRSISVGHDGFIWIATFNKGLDRLDPKTGTVRNFRHNPSQKNGIGSNQLLRLCTDRSGIIWIGHVEKGLERFDPRAKTFTPLSDGKGGLPYFTGEYFRDIYQGESGYLWVGTDSGGLGRVDPTTGELVRYPSDPFNPKTLNENRIFSIAEDRTGGLWVGTKNHGISKADMERNNFRHLTHNPADSNSLSSNVVWEIAEDASGHIWFATEKGLDRYNSENGTFKHYKHDYNDPNSLGGKTVRSMMIDPSGIIWLGLMPSGLDRFDPKTGIFTHYIPDPSRPETRGLMNIHGLAPDPFGFIWFSSFYDGLSRLNPETGEIVNYRHDPKNPNSISINTAFKVIVSALDGRIWVSTFGGGLNVLNPSTGKFKRYRHDPDDPNSLSHNAVMEISEDRAGRLWIGTYGGGLNRFDPSTETFTRYNTEDGLPDNTILSVLTKGGSYFWLGTSNGIVMFDPNNASFKRFGKRHGLSTNFFREGGIISKKGEIFFASKKGVDLFFPEEIGDNPYLPVIAFTDFKLFNKSVPIGAMVGDHIPLKQSISVADSIELGPDDDVIAFEFAALHYAAPEWNEYAYRLEGFETQWNNVGTRNFASYTNLPAGKYTFRVKASNSDGVWVSSGTSLDIIVAPPIWLTWWFKLLTFIAISIAITAIYKFRVRVIQKRAATLQNHNHQLQEQIDQRKKAEALALERENRLNRAQQLANVGSWEWDVKKGVITLSEQARRIWGLEDKNDIHHSDLRDLTHPDDIEMVEQSEARLLDRIETFKPLVFRIIRADGQLRWLSAVPPEIKERDHKSAPLIVVGTIQDITERQMALELVVQAEKLASLGSLTAGIAHEIKNPLGGVIQNIQLIRQRLFDDIRSNNQAAEESGITMEILRSYMEKRGIKRMISAIIEAGIRASTIIDNMLLFSRKRDTTAELKDPAELLEQTVEIAANDYDLKKKYDFRRIRIQRRFDPSVPRILCHGIEIQQVFLNILKNGSEAMFEAKIQKPRFDLRISKDGSSARIEIKDNGPGMDESIKNRIFEPFFTTKGVGKGTGLGMSVSHSIITRNHGGSIIVESEPDQGTNFIIRLPFSGGE